MQAQAQTNASARVHPAPKQFRFFAQCSRFSSNGNPQPSEVLRRSTVLLLLARLSAPNDLRKMIRAKKRKPNRSWHCNHPPSKEAMPVPLG
jgi:hypothetical protein